MTKGSTRSTWTTISRSSSANRARYPVGAGQGRQGIQAVHARCDAWWAATCEYGDADGTRALGEVLMMHQHLPHDRRRRTRDGAACRRSRTLSRWKRASTTTQQMAEPTTRQAGPPVPDERRQGTRRRRDPAVRSLTERRLRAHIPADARPLPAWKYDQLLASRRDTPNESRTVTTQAPWNDRRSSRRRDRPSVPDAANAHHPQLLHRLRRPGDVVNVLPRVPRRTIACRVRRSRPTPVRTPRSRPPSSPAKSLRAFDFDANPNIDPARDPHPRQVRMGPEGTAAVPIRTPAPASPIC